MTADVHKVRTCVFLECSRVCAQTPYQLLSYLGHTSLLFLTPENTSKFLSQLYGAFRLLLSLTPLCKFRPNLGLDQTYSSVYRSPSVIHNQAPSALRRAKKTVASMSFGFGVGDFLAVLQLANDVRKKISDAPEEL